MDGGGRLLRSVNQPSGAPRTRALAAVQNPAFAPETFAFPAFPSPSRKLAAPQRRAPASGWLGALERFAERWHKGLGLALSLLLIGSAGLYGAVRGGQYEAFIAANGTLKDAIARGLGFNISAITITSQGGLSEKEILSAAGVNPNTSLPFLDAAAVRDRLMTNPVISDAQVRKLYPDRLAIEITENQPYALWQKDGQVQMVSGDGNVIGLLTDSRYAGLPFVIGEGANTRVREFLNLMDILGDQKAKFRAGTLIGGRRWNLKTTGGLDVKLPEQNPAEALKMLTEIERQSRILEKDILSLDLRVPGKIEARLTQTAADLRAENAPKKKAGSEE